MIRADRNLAVLLLALVAAAMLFTVGATLVVRCNGERLDGPKAPAGVVEPEEDDPGWSCVLDGNRRCGTETDR